MPRLLALLPLSLVWLPALSWASISSPQEFTGKPVGADRTLLVWEEILPYLKHLAEESPRLHLETLGETTLGRPFVMAVVSDAAGVRNRQDSQRQNRRLYEARGRSDEDARKIAAGGKAVLAFSLGLHSSEVGATQASLELLHELVTNEEPWMQRVRENLLLLIVPSMNPDGLDIVANWYNESVGTQAEGTLPPWLYHHYAGHDNNRDGFFNNLAETALWSKLLYHDWLPQMIVDEHQMGSSGPRLFLPPFDDPLSPSVHRLVYSQLSAAGQQTVSDLTALGWTGVATSTIFTGEWPGSVRSTGFWHNMLGILSEVASARLATPLHFPPGSLRGRGRGLPEYGRRANFLEPWLGGWWRLRDIINLEKDLTWSLLRWASDHKEDLLYNFHQMNRDAIAAGSSQPPYGFVIGLDQPDPGAAHRLAEILDAGGIELSWLNGPVEVQGRVHPAGAYLALADQPFRPFLVEMLGNVPYPMMQQQDGSMVRPYDVTAWRLSDLLHVDVQALQAPWTEDRPRLLDEVPRREDSVPRGSRLRLSGKENLSYQAALKLLAQGEPVERIVSGPTPGDFLVRTDQAGEIARSTGAIFREEKKTDSERVVQRAPRIGLYAPWGGNMDEGWTRLVLDRYGFEHSQLRNEDLQKRDGAKLARDFDVIVLPSLSKGTMSRGEQSDGSTNLHEAFWPRRYRGGLGEDSTGGRLLAFARAGGTVIAFNHACDWVVDTMHLPVRVQLDNVNRDAFYAPGTLVKAVVDPQNPLAWGMPTETAVYFASGRAFRPVPWPQATSVPVRYAPQDVLRAGYLVGEELLRDRPALVDIPVEAGYVVLFGFSPQRRAQTESTFKLVFNALLRAAQEPAAD